jgi:hypothetical protein
MVGRLGRRIFETCGSSVADLGSSPPLVTPADVLKSEAFRSMR